jgi:spermidine synthase
MLLNNSRRVCYLLFAVSGFTGLVYESVWSHYLKLFLGHAAYAQTLVLSIFMGGMAIGAWLTSRYTARWQNLLLGYALIEAIIGAFALLFHNAFSLLSAVSFTLMIPLLGEPLWIEVYRWSVAVLLILPPSLLLGMTFPLMSWGLLRRHSNEQGASLAHALLHKQSRCGSWSLGYCFLAASSCRVTRNRSHGRHH